MSESALASALQNFSREADTVDQLTAFVREFVSPSFDVRSSAILGLDGQQSDNFPLVIFIASGPPVVDGQPIPIDRVAAVVETVDDLDIEALHCAYAKIARLKAIKKTPVPKGDAFDKVFQSSLSSLTKARDACREYHKILADHVARVEAGEIGKISAGNMQILENADGKLSTEFETFLNAASRSIKTGLQALAAHLGNDIGFLFKKQGAFDAGLAKLSERDP